MKNSVHTPYLLLLFTVAVLGTVLPAIYGWGYYATPLEERPFHPLYETLKPTGLIGHGYGVVGSLMILTGVGLYSSRKRLRVLASLGKIKYFLEFHIFLCLLGPILVVYHTTFKIGGLVAVSFWSMTAVVLSGLIGRYFYVQIPKGIQGNELSVGERTAENKKLAETLTTRFRLDADLLRRIDAIASPPKDPVKMSLTETIQFFIVNDLTRRARLRAVFGRLEQQSPHRHALKTLRATATRRIILTRRIALLQQFRRIFHYWHVVHLPFSIIMVVILLIHVAVAIAFGYTWVW
jgi:hypothetical protein